jgi:hypothetical protein
MTQMQLIQHISAFDKDIKVAKLSSQLNRGNFSLKNVVDLTFYHDKQVALNAARLLDTMLLKYPENYCDEIEYLVMRVNDVKCESCKRYYAKIIMYITSPEIGREVRNKVKEINFENVVELCFDWLIDPKILTRVKSSACESLFNLRHRYPWVAEELSKQLQHLMRDATPTLLTKGNLILSYLHCED